MQKKERGNLAFGVLFIVLSLTAIVLLGIVMFRLLRSGRTVFSAVTDAGKPTPAVEEKQKPGEEKQPETSSSPKPVVTPVIGGEDRIMPQLDGASPVLPAAGENSIPVIFESINESVLGVLNYQTQKFGSKEMLEVFATGSGVAVSSGGYILTNQHVVDKAEKIEIVLITGEKIEAKLIGADEDTDIAVLKVDGKELKPAPIGDSDKVRVGEYVLAIGNPIDSERLANTLTLGIISAKERSITIDGHTNTYLQTDAAINYGNSGGPLINMAGEIIGINSAKTIVAGYDSLGLPVSAEGIGFALPINDVIRIMEILVEQGSVKRPAIGIMVTTLTESSAAELGTVPGVYVESVVKDGPADKAGLKPGDIIRTADGKAFEEHPELVEYIATKRIGDTLVFGILRGDEELTITIDLGDKSGMDFNNLTESEQDAEKKDTEKED